MWSALPYGQDIQMYICVGGSSERHACVERKRTKRGASPWVHQLPNASPACAIKASHQHCCRVAQLGLRRCGSSPAKQYTMTTGCIYFRQLRVWLPVLLCNSTDAPRLSRWALHQVHVLFAGSLQAIIFKWRRKTFCRDRKAASILPMGSQGPITELCSPPRQTRPGQRSAFRLRYKRTCT